MITGKNLKNIVLVGGGHTHALVLRMWARDPIPGARLTVINPGSMAAYSGMLPGYVAGHYQAQDLHIDLGRLANLSGATFVDGRAQGLDLQSKSIALADGRKVSYDVASIDIGVTSDMPSLAGFAEHAAGAKPLGRFATKWDHYRRHASVPRVAVIGGGVAGVELALAMAHAFRDRAAQITILDRDGLLAGFGGRARRHMRNALNHANVKVIENVILTEVVKDAVRLADGQQIASDFTVGAAGARPQEWLRQTGLSLHNGYIAIAPDLRSSDPCIFAVGDCAHMTETPRPKAGVFAVRQAPILFENLRSIVSGRQLQNYTPQKDYLKLISLGDKVAMAEKRGVVLNGRLLWRLKDHIDRKFMRQFT
ncbi:FAD-dependent oxidoreductase [Loktanella sp. S4079]|uniref:FAD-dependent oxidoreductase n=1 Tax=Loktanella sp. S4079 TaxID=579483 RepID=UPI000698D08B|nr:FAD-dependent oxidoreductase [Loktanella sp. S4079]